MHNDKSVMQPKLNKYLFALPILILVAIPVIIAVQHQSLKTESLLERQDFNTPSVLGVKEQATVTVSNSIVSFADNKDNTVTVNYLFEFVNPGSSAVKLDSGIIEFNRGKTFIPNFKVTRFSSPIFSLNPKFDASTSKSIFSSPQEIKGGVTTFIEMQVIVDYTSDSPEFISYIEVEGAEVVQAAAKQNTSNSGEDSKPVVAETKPTKTETKPKTTTATKPKTTTTTKPKTTSKPKTTTPKVTTDPVVDPDPKPVTKPPAPKPDPKPVVVETPPKPVVQPKPSQQTATLVAKPEVSAEAARIFDSAESVFSFAFLTSSEDFGRILGTSTNVGSSGSTPVQLNTSGKK